MAGTSDYRGPPMLPDQQTPSYSTITQQKAATFPSKLQAVIIPAVDTLKLEDYVTAIGSLVQPKNVLFSSRISNGRICIYLSSKEVVDTFLTDHGGKKIGR
uniref:Uncharacterized protein LOC114324948 n=1 Tax=Diabrotica virgifera virgifera TaxID=50390 RepID=A0A6P7F5E5_DIAVI